MIALPIRHLLRRRYGKVGAQRGTIKFDYKIPVFSFCADKTFSAVMEDIGKWPVPVQRVVSCKIIKPKRDLTNQNNTDWEYYFLMVDLI